MFSFGSVHKKYANRIQEEKNQEKQKTITTEYFRKKIDGKKIPYNASHSHPLLIDLNSKLKALKELIKPNLHSIVDEGYAKALNEAFEKKPELKPVEPQPQFFQAPPVNIIPPEPLVTSNGLPISAEAWEKLQSVGNRFEIPEQALRDLALYLSKRDIRFVIDDSLSMVKEDEVNRSGKPCTRWQALAERVGIAAEIASCLDPDGLNLYFLNTEPKIVRNLMTVYDVINEFSERTPVGYTPLRIAIESALNDGEDKPLLIEIATDGEPTDEAPPGFKPKPEDIIQTIEGPCYIDREVSVRLERVLNTRTPIGANKPPKSDVCFGVMLCNRGDEVAWWNGVDKRVDKLDVNGCYQDEAKQVKSTTGKHFSFGEYLAKVLLGPVRAEYDNQDESKPTFKMK